MHNIEIEITKSWRKSLSMRFDKTWVLQVKAPKFLLRSQINEFISKNQVWIDKEYAKNKQREENKKHYLFWEELDASEIKDIEKYYKSEAKQYIVPRCNELAEEHWFTHKWIRINSAVTRWGSCSSKKTLNFSYRLIMSPPESIDYVIIHELCHLRQMNHGSKFWSEVAAIMPDYKVYESHLKKEWWRYRV
jgi:predicted metal-dependent hydrolase